MLRRPALFLLAVVVGTPLAAQRAPRRPRLGAEADTNDATAYFQLGLQRLERDPALAGAAFYWSARLDPMSPQALYAQGVAGLLRLDRARLVRYLNRDARLLALPEIRVIDSLRFRAEMQDPFLHRGMDELLLVEFARAASRSDDWLGGPAGSASARSGLVTGSPGSTTGVMAATERYLESADPYLRGLWYYSQGQLRSALQYWAIAQRAQEVDWVWAERARAWAELRQLDSAQKALQEAIRLRHGPNDDTEKPVYQSAAAWRFALGRVLEDRRDTAGARAAYEQALGWDEGYYPALFRTAVLTLQQRDTAGAVASLRRVVGRPDVQYFACAAAATILTQLGRHQDATDAMQRATAIEPLASAGWLMLARTLTSTRDTTGAVEAYQRYLALAPQADGMRPAAVRALASLRAGP